MTVIQCLQKDIVSGGTKYPVFVGFLSASEILEIAEAPSFSKETSNEQIAQNILTPPIKDWQRPKDDVRIKDISDLFNDTGEVMPNPVLLCQNTMTPHNLIKIEPQKTTGGFLTSVWEINIPQRSQGEQYPLWILDGQHRINGLSKSKQAYNPIPVVLLLNQGQNVYGGPLVAKLFAQVTTSAEKLDDLHNEWLTFAFKLKNYSDSPKYDKYRKAMECIAHLCKTHTLTQTGQSNPFFNQVKFKIGTDVSLAAGGFAYNCIELKDILSKHYYDASTQLEFHLPPFELSQQIGLAYLALTQVVQVHDKSVFFGESTSGQRIMQDAFIVGILSYLLHHGVPPSWESIFRTLAFHTTNWNFSWIVTLNGTAQTISKKLAINIFSKAFRESKLPTDQSNLADYLSGDSATLELEFSHLTSTQKPAKQDKHRYTLMTGSKRSIPITPRKHVKKSDSSENIGKLTFIDKRPSPTGIPIEYRELSRGGIVLDPAKHHSPLELVINMEHYGGVTSRAEVNILW
jgi:DGQHR domain-containing protein